MTGSQPPPCLAARLFRAVYPGFELRTADGMHVAVLKGSSRYAGDSLGGIARQISAEPPGPDLDARLRPHPGSTR